MRYAAFPIVAFLLAGTAGAIAQPPAAGSPPPAGGEEIVIPPLNNPNYLDPGPMPDNPGSDKSMDYMNQAGGDDMGLSGPGSDIGSDVQPANDGAYNNDPLLND